MPSSLPFLQKNEKRDPIHSLDLYYTGRLPIKQRFFGCILEGIGRIVSVVLENAIHDAFAFRMINAINVSGIPVSGKDTILQNIPDILVCYSVKKIRCNKCKSGQSLLPVNDKDFSFDLVCYKHIQVIPRILVKHMLQIPVRIL